VPENKEKKMEIFITEEIFNRILNSLAKELLNYYGTTRPVLIGVGISGIEIVGRLPQYLGDPNIEIYVCDVERKNGQINAINFPSDKISGKKVLITYARVDTGKTLSVLSELALHSGATDVKTLSIAVRESALFFPNFFSFMIKDEDNMYLLLKGYPPDISFPYPTVVSFPNAFIHELTVEDTCKGWFKCGDERIDKMGPGEYLYYKKLSKQCRVFVIDDGKRIIGILHFSKRKNRIWIDTLAISKDLQGQGFGSRLISFLIDWCKFNNVRWIYLDAFYERENFYRKLNFSKIEEFEIPSYGKLSRMKRRVF
jgi:GNAT superfamily N-acetyltransferase/hypoxanthine-guanine phosphoribosyltransferase